MKLIYKLIATALGVGYSPYAPGTMGALMGCVTLLIFNILQILPTHPNPLVYVLVIGITTIIGIFATNKLLADWGKDPSKVVIDEVVGMWITMVFIPFTWINLLIGFGLFRLFDIYKPFGIRKMENLKDGLGVMADDVLAGIYANIILQIFSYYTIDYFSFLT